MSTLILTGTPTPTQADPPSVAAAREYLVTRDELRRAQVRVELAHARLESERETLAAWHAEAEKRRRALEAALMKEATPANDWGIV